MQNDKQLVDLEMQRKGRKVFILMIVFFAVPILVVVLMFKFNWKPTGSSLGELINPPRLLSSTSMLKNNLGQAVPEDFWKDKWSVVYAAGDCQKTCQEKLLDMRRLHASLYKDIDRAQRVFITTTQDVKSIKQDFPDLIVINQPVPQIGVFLKQFQISNERVETSNRLYLVDPLGHVMMSYRPDFPLADVRKDITHLLSTSWAG